MREALAMKTRSTVLVLVMQVFMGAFAPRVWSADLGPQSSVARSFQTKDSGYLGRGGTAQEIFWIDNEQVLFIGQKPPDKADREQSFARSRLYIWNVRTGVVRARDETLPDIKVLCFRSAYAAGEPGGVPIEGGYVRYVFDRNNVPYVRHGRLYVERENELNAQGLKNGVVAVSPISCREFNPKQLEKKYGAKALPLLAEGEYVGRFDSSAQSFSYFPPEGEPVVAHLPVDSILPTPRYSDHARKYIFRELRSHASAPMTMWTLDRRGKVEQFVLPQGPWMEGSVDAMPIRGGWFFSSAAGQKVGGAYVVLGSSASHVVPGWPASFAISPNGCTAAIAIGGRSSNEPLSRRIQAIDLCQKGL